MVDHVCELVRVRAPMLLLPEVDARDATRADEREELAFVTRTLDRVPVVPFAIASQAREPNW